MAERTGVNYNVISTECGNLNKYEKEYASIEQGVKSIVNVLQTWEGEDAKQALAVLDKIQKDMIEIRESISNIAKWGQQVSDNYAEAERIGKKAYSSFA